MREQNRDPLAALPGLIDGPVTPRAAFAEELHDRLLADLSAGQIDEEVVMRAQTVITTPAITLPPQSQRSRRGIRSLLEIAAVLALVISLIAALLPNRTGNDQPPPTIDAVQGVAPVAMSSPVAGEEGASSQMRDDLLWQLPPRDDAPFFTETVLVGDTLYRSIRSRSFIGVEAINVGTGAQSWQQATPIGGQIAADENGVYVVASSIDPPEELTGTPESITFLEPPEMTVVALDPATGEERWRANTGDLAVSPIVRNDVLYVRDNPLFSLQAFDTTESIFAIDTGDGSIIWEQVIGNPHRGIGLDPSLDSMVVDDTSLAIVTSSGILAVLDIATGEVRWHLQGFQLLTTDLALLSGRLVVSGYFQTPLRVPSEIQELSSPAGIIGFGVEDGSVRWTINTGSTPADLALAELDLVAVMGSTPGERGAAATPETALDYTVSGIDPGIGQITWIATAGIGEPPEIYPAADGSDVAVLFDADRQSLQFVDTEAGYLLSNSLVLDTPIVGLPLIDSRNGAAYLSFADGSLIAQRLNRGYSTEQVVQAASQEATSEPESSSGWMIPAPSTSDTMSSPELVIDSGMVFRTIQAGERDITLQAISVRTGAILWTQPIDWYGASAPTDGFSVVHGGLAAGDGLVFVMLSANIPFAGESDIVQFEGGGFLAAFDQARGRLVWVKEIGLQFGPLVYHDGSLILRFSDLIQSFDAVTAEEQWRVSLGTESQRIFSPTTDLAITGDTLIAVAADGTITGIDLTNGKIKWWQALTEGTPLSDASPSDLGVMDIDAAGDQVVILGMHIPTSNGTPVAEFTLKATDGWVKALDVSTGELRWATDTVPAPIWLTIADDSVTVISIDPLLHTSADTAGLPNVLTRLDLNTGQPTGWTWAAADDALLGNIRSPDGSLLLIGTWSGDLVVVETSVLSTALPRTVPVSPQSIVGAPVITEGLVLVTTQDGTLRAIPLATVLDA